MTGIRLSFVYSKEDEFGKGLPDKGAWIAPPPGARFRCTMNRQTTRIQAVGTKHWDTYAYGVFQGSWDMTFMLDYNYLEPFYFVFENATQPTKPQDKTYYTCSFAKADAKRVPSFTVRLVQLNNMAGGPAGSDQIVTLKGCVCKSMTLARAAGSSQFQVTMSGFYVDEVMEKGVLTKTDYQEYTGNLAEYSCLYTSEAAEADGLEDCNYVANTESLTVAIDNSAEAIYNVCSPFATQYHEGTTNYTFSAVTYRNNPANWEQRVYTGGQTNTAKSPLSKGLRPMNLAYILTYSAEVDESVEGRRTPKEAYESSDYAIGIKIQKCVISSLERPNGEGSKLVDSISSADCQLISLDVRTSASTFGFKTTDNNPHAVSAVVPSTE